MPTLELRQGPIAYRDVGAGPVVVFVHGLLVDGRLWSPLVARLSSTHRCIVPDWPLGSHRIAMKPDADLSPPGLADLVLDFLDALELRDVTLVGNDSGGAVCQIACARAPARIARLVLTNCDAFEVFPPKQFAYLKHVVRVPGMPAIMTKLMARSRRLRALPLAYGALAAHGLDDALATEWVAPAARDRAIRRDLAKVVRGIDPRHTIEAAAKLRLPVRLVWGDADRFFTVALAGRLAAAIPGATLSLVPGAATFVPLDAPDEIAHSIRSWQPSASSTTSAAS